MSRITSTTLDDHVEAFLARQLAEGRYGSASEAVRAGLRLLEEQERQLGTLRQTLEEGERSGPATRFDFDDVLQGRAHASGE